jgi:hypothetical protein
MPTEALGEFDYDPRQQLPYGSEFYLKELPLAPTSPVGQLAGQVGSFVPLSPMPAVRGAQTVGRMVGQRMAENVAMGRPSLPSMLAEPRSSLFAVEPSPMMPKPQAQVSELGFYSAAEQAAMNLPRNKGTGQSFLNDLMKAPDVKKDELAWTGLDDFLANKPNVTKQEVQDFIANNRVDVKERQLSGRGDKSGVFSEFNPDKNKFIIYGNDLSLHGSFDTAQEADAFVKQFNASIPYGPSKYDKYQLPGGENYREILLTMPANMSEYNKYTQVLREKYGQGGFQNLPLTDIERARLDKFYAAEDATPYQSSHFNEPNILAHIRVNDRVDADGKKMLLIEEIQSDWHQAGREKGYASKETKRIKGTVEEQPSDYGFQTDYKVVWEDGTFSGGYGSKEIAEVVAARGKTNAKEGVPDAPFKDTWYQLALKRVLKHAADNGYERVGLTTGKQQAERFDLSKQVDYIDYVREGQDKYRMAIVGKDGQGVNLPKEIFSETELKNYLGNDVAKKIVDGEGQSGGGRMTLRGPDLTVGGQGMKKYYDEIYPKFLDKYGKKWNARVGETQISTGDNAWNMAEQIKMRGISDAQWRAMSEADKLTLWNEIKKSEGKTQESIRYIDITPEMKGAVSKGQPLFAAVPVGSIGLGYQKDKIDNVEETSLTYTDPFGNTIGSSIR